MNSSLRRLLIVEDNPSDVAFLRHALDDHGLVADVAVADDGEQAIQYLDTCADDTRPHLVVIDLGLPRTDGIEVLRKCRFTPSLTDTRTMILTSSEHANDYRRAELLGVHAYARKPLALAGFRDIAATIGNLIR